MSNGSAIPERPLIPGLEAKHFAHPLDVSARRRIDQLIAGKPRIRRLFASLERSLQDEEHLMSLADNTRLNARQAPSLYRLVESVASDARMPTPRVFLDTQPEVKAWALGQHDPMIVLNRQLSSTSSPRRRFARSLHTNSGTSAVNTRSIGSSLKGSSRLQRSPARSPGVRSSRWRCGGISWMGS